MDKITTELLSIFSTADSSEEIEKITASLDTFCNLLPLNVLLFNLKTSKIEWSRTNTLAVKAKDFGCESLEELVITNVIHPDDLTNFVKFFNQPYSDFNAQNNDLLCRIVNPKTNDWDWMLLKVAYIPSFPALLILLQNITQLLSNRRFQHHINKRNKAFQMHLLSQRLSEREIEVLELVTQALSDQEIAKELGITKSTVAAHLRNLSRKLNLKSKLELMRFGLKCGIDN